MLTEAHVREYATTFRDGAIYSSGLQQSDLYALMLHDWESEFESRTTARRTLRLIKWLDGSASLRNPTTFQDLVSFATDLSDLAGKYKRCGNSDICSSMMAVSTAISTITDCMSQAHGRMGN